MPEKGLFFQNDIALIWDFDKTLSPHYMQRPLFEAYDINEETFWSEVNLLPGYYAKAGIQVQPDTCYLGHLLTYVRSGRMKGLTNARLRELGAHIEFYPGLPECFKRLSAIVEETEFKEGDLHVEHYVVSTGLRAMVEGSKIAPYLDGIWASEFIEEAAPPGVDRHSSPKPGPISQIAGLLDNTTKTRAIFEINKGVNKLPEITVNTTVPLDERRVPLENMIYVADGPSDIPVFSVVRKHGGLTFAVHDGTEARFRQAVQLHSAGRVDAYGKADYRPGTDTDMWLQLQVREIARRMLSKRKAALKSKVSREPVHLNDSKTD